MMMLTFIFLCFGTAVVTYELSIDQRDVIFNGNSDELTQNDVERSKVYANYVTCVISKGIISIGIGAFRNCINLQTVEISGTVKVLKTEAFMGCSSLGDVVIPEGVLEIQENCFAISGITSISLPSSLETITKNPFFNTQRLREIVVEFNSKFSSLDNKFLVQDGTTLIASAGYQEIQIPAQIEVLSNNCFESNIVQRLTFEEGSHLVEIKASAFRSTTISTMTIPEGTQILGASLFDRCSITELWLPSTLISVDSNVLKDCSTIKKVHVPENCSAIKTDSSGTIYNSDQTAVIFMQTDIESFHIPEALHSILTTALTLKWNLVNLSCEENNTEFYIYNNTLYKKNSKELYAVIGGASIIDVDPMCTRIGDSSFKSTNIRIIRFGGTNVKSIASCAFEGMPKLESLVLPENLESMSVYVFSGASLDTLEFPSTFKTFSDSSMRNAKIRRVDLHKCTNLIEIPDNGFHSSSVEEIVFPSSLQILSTNSFFNCKNLKTITFPSSLNYIHQNAFKDCILESIEFDDGANITLGSQCFAGNKFETLNLSNRINIISENAFEDCALLTEVKFNEDSFLEIIGPFIFKGCKLLTKITFGANLRIIEGCALTGTESLDCVVIPDSNEYFCSENGIVYSKNMSILVLCLSGIENIDIDKRVTSIAQNAFYECTRLVDVSFGTESGVTSIGPSTFYGCSNLRQLVLPKSLELVPESCFSGCGLTDVVFVDETVVESIGAQAFFGCPIKSIDLRCCNKLKSLGVSAFEECIELVDVFLPPALTAIESNCFANCQSLSRIEFCASSSLTVDPCDASALSSQASTVIIVGIKYTPQTLCNIGVQRMLDSDCNLPTSVFSAAALKAFRVSDILSCCLGADEI